MLRALLLQKRPIGKKKGRTMNKIGIFIGICLFAGSGIALSDTTVINDQWPVKVIISGDNLKTEWELAPREGEKRATGFLESSKCPSDFIAFIKEAPLLDYPDLNSPRHQRLIVHKKNERCWGRNKKERTFKIIPGPDIQ